MTRTLREYLIKKEFGWTQAQMNDENADDIDAYVQIINIKGQLEQQKANSGR